MYCTLIPLKAVTSLKTGINFVNRFTKVVPVAYEEMHAAIERYKEQGLSLEEAQLDCIQRKNMQNNFSSN